MWSLGELTALFVFLDTINDWAVSIPSILGEVGSEQASWSVVQDDEEVQN